MLMDESHNTINMLCLLSVLTHKRTRKKAQAFTRQKHKLLHEKKRKLLHGIKVKAFTRKVNDIPVNKKASSLTSRDYHQRTREETTVTITSPSIELAYDLIIIT